MLKKLLMNLCSVGFSLLSYRVLLCKVYINLYKIKMQLFNVCILCIVWLKIANYILHRPNVKNPTFDRTRFGFRIFDIRQTADQMSNIRYPKKHASDVEYSAFDGRMIESKKSDPTMCRIESNLRHSILQNAHV